MNSAPATEDVRGREGRYPRWTERLAFVLIWIPYTLLVRRFWFVTDDAYISFRFCRNWAEGNGLRYNLGEHAPVEGYSNFLLVVIGTVVERLGLGIELCLPLVSFASGSILLYMVFRVARSYLGASLTVSCLATAFLGWSAQFAVWSTGGLETMLYALLLFAAFERLVLRPGAMAPVAGGLFATLLALTRPEGIYWALLLAPMAAASRRFRTQSALRPTLTYLGVLALGYGTYFLWRYGYYGNFFASTVHSKVAFSRARFWRGFCYVVVQFLTILPLFVVLPGLILAWKRRRRAVAIPAALISLGFVALSILVSGDFMTFGRFLVPALAFDALLFAWILDDLGAGMRRRRRTAAVVGLTTVALGLLPGWNIHLVPHSVRAAFHFRHNRADYRSEYEQWQLMGQNSYDWALIGRILGGIAPPGASVVTHAFGAVGYESGLTVYDGYGFVTPGVAALRSEAGADLQLRSPGHDYPLHVTFFVAQGYDPTFLRPILVRPARRETLPRIIAAQNELILGRLDVSSRYAPDFYGVPKEDPTDPQERRRIVILWRRVPEDRAAQEWKALKDRVDRYVQTGDIRVLDIELPPGPPLGLPRWM